MQTLHQKNVIKIVKSSIQTLGNAKMKAAHINLCICIIGIISSHPIFSTGFLTYSMHCKEELSSQLTFVSSWLHYSSLPHLLQANQALPSRQNFLWLLWHLAVQHCHASNVVFMGYWWVSSLFYR